MNMFKTNKKNVLELKHENTPPLPTFNSKGENENFKQRVRLKEIKDINGMKITYDVIKKKN